MNYNVGTTPNYNGPVMDFSSFFDNNKPKQLGQVQPSPANVQNMPGTKPTLQPAQSVTFVDRLRQFLAGPHGDQMVGRPNLLPSNPPVQPTVVGQDRGDY
jgi:hypothetical protein